MSVETENHEIMHVNTTSPWDDRFSTERVNLSEGQSILVAKLKISNASLYHVALTILAEYEFLSANSNTSNNKLRVAYEQMDDSTGKSISLKKMAEQVVKLCDKYNNEYIQTDFINSTVCVNWKWSGETSGKYALGHMFSRDEYHVTLHAAKFMLLVKAFRLYLIETVKNSFRSSDESDAPWHSKDAIYRVRIGGIVVQQTCVEFVEVVTELLKMYRKITKFSPDLREFKSIMKEVDEINRLSKKAEHRQKMQEEFAKKLKDEREAKEKKNADKLVKTDAVKYVFVTPAAPVENKWLKAKPIIVMDEDAKKAHAVEITNGVEINVNKQRTFQRKPHGAVVKRS